MDHGFWLQAWEDGRTNFHRDAVSPTLPAHARAVFPGSGTILVPLCGASVDLRWLADAGWSVLGVELSPLACARLAERDGLEPVDPRGPFAAWARDGVTVLCGDFFALTPALAGPIAGIWDRAALVALHPDQRAGYVAVQRALLGSGGVLLDVLAYDQTRMDGPPWSVDADVVRALWPEARLIAEDPQEAPPRFQERGLDRFVGQTWAIAVVPSSPA